MKWDASHGLKSDGGRAAVNRIIILRCNAREATALELDSSPIIIMAEQNVKSVNVSLDKKVSCPLGCFGPSRISAVTEIHCWIWDFLFWGRDGLVD